MDLPEELRGLDPEEVIAFLREASDAEIADRVHRMGTARVLDLVFQGWTERIEPRDGRSPGLLVLALDDEGTEHRHGLVLTPAGATAVREPVEPARATLRTSLVRFLRVAAGAQDPKRLVLTGRMRFGGDALWAVTTLAGLQQR
jgi:hypothetical protein